MSGATLATAMLRAGGNFDRMIRDTALRHSRRSTQNFPHQLRMTAGTRCTRRSPRRSNRSWMSSATPRTSPAPSAVTIRHRRAAVDHFWMHSFPYQAQRRLTDAGTGSRVEGPIAALLLLTTGRPTAISQLSGPDVATLPATFGHRTAAKQLPQEPNVA